MNRLKRKLHCFGAFFWTRWCNITLYKMYKLLCDSDCTSSLICGNKIATRCNRGFYCRSYCLLNMFRAPLCPSPGAQEYYTVVAACGISCCGFQVAALVWSWGLCIRFAGCCSTKYHRQQPLYNALELLMMGIVVPEICWASNKICKENHLLYINSTSMLCSSRFNKCQNLWGWHQLL